MKIFEDKISPSYKNARMTDILLITGSGYYIFIEASSPRVPGDMARILSPPIAPSSSPLCLHFWHHMYGLSIGSLNVSSRSNSSNPGEQGNLLWSRSGGSIDEWQPGYVTLNESEPFQVGMTVHGDLLSAITDIWFSNKGTPLWSFGVAWHLILNA